MTYFPQIIMPRP